MVENGKKIILFDGVCNLCNGFVQFVINRDKNDVFRYASLQSEIGQQLISERAIDAKTIDSVILIEPGVAYYIKSDAALQIGRHLRGYRTLQSYWIWFPVVYVISYMIIRHEIVTNGMVKKINVRFPHQN